MHDKEDISQDNQSANEKQNLTKQSRFSRNTKGLIRKEIKPQIFKNVNKLDMNSNKKMAANRDGLSQEVTGYGNSDKEMALSFLSNKDPQKYA